ncbi:MAG: peptide deformylase [Deltaproteobacteria bacterium]|nr:peptide deformylase [Deltaproteobacteria bacterium]
MLLKIVQTGDPVLRQTGRTLSKKEILSPGIQQLVELMRETMRDAPGVGLAAPQVGLPLQLAVIEDDAEALSRAPKERLKSQERRGVPFHVVINPKIELVDPTPVTQFEGCLSVSGFSALVPRARGVKVEALDHKGRPVKIEASGWYARILQHEIDHLHGTLYIDRMHTRSYSTVENQARHLEGLPLKELKDLLAIKE